MLNRPWIRINAFILAIGLCSGLHGITQEGFDALFPSLLKEVLKNRSDINSGKKNPSIMYSYLWYKEGYDAKAYAFLELSFPFFELSPEQIESYLKKTDIKRINAMLEQCADSPEDTPLRARVAYNSLLQAAILPEDVDKNTLAGNPEKFKEFLEQNKVNKERHNSSIAESLVVRHCCKHKEDNK